MLTRRLSWLAFSIILAVSTSMSYAQSQLPAPAYLRVPHFKNCLKTKAKQGAQFWCLPKKRPDSCPRSSWKKLEGLLNKPAHQC